LEVAPEYIEPGLAVVLSFSNSHDDYMAHSVTQPGDVDSKFARDAWLRALGKTANIGDQGVTLPELMLRLAGEFGAATALESP
jgi:hypothetical protein